MTEVEKEEHRRKLRECFAAIREMLDKMEAECLDCGGHVEVRWERPAIEAPIFAGDEPRMVEGPDIHIEIHATVAVDWRPKAANGSWRDEKPML